MLVLASQIKNVCRIGCGLRSLAAEQFRGMGHPGVRERREDPRNAAELGPGFQTRVNQVTETMV